MKQFGPIIKLMLGPVLFLVSTMIPSDQLSQEGILAIGIGLWMVAWWVTEAAPIAVTSLLPIVLFPTCQIMSISDVTAMYGHRFVFLFLGGFIIALAMEKWKLHQRIAVNIVNATGSSERKIVLGFMIATAFLSMWVSNTATTLLMMPIALSVASLFSANNHSKKSGFVIACLLSIAYAANVGGISTLVGTPPNAAMAGIIEDQTGRVIGFSEWMKWAFPFSITLLVLVYVFLTRVLFKLNKKDNPNVAQALQERVKALGSWSNPEVRVMLIFATTAVLWMSRSLLNKGLPFKLDDTVIGITMSIMLFILPAGDHKKKSSKLLDWDDTSKLPWGILLLFGGGMALASGFKTTGVMEYLGVLLSDFATWPLILLLLIMILVALFATELMSNLALVNVLIPMVLVVSQSSDLPFMQLAVPVTIASSCAFMFPMATPPNAIVFSSNQITISQMARAGIVLNLIATGLLVAMIFAFIQLGWI
ncbi:MAG: DASS family sodium-coupled anion symporter [Flavobacteriales bacterium]|nr:DASS family sodium-coupled anion symporter [Flavobacteriales bacterium]